MSNTLSYLRQNKMPHIWCPGCGNGTVMSNIIRAIDASGIDPAKTVIVSGIGCSSRAPGYMNFDTLHTAHGRAIPFATGIKMANPELNVIVITGDGDCTAIGGNHLIHGCRRNIDITVVLVNNNIYGMTSGQYSPLTPTGAWATTAQYGNIDRPFDIPRVVAACGATYVARASVYHVPQLKTYIENGIKHKGFSVIEAVSICPTYFGRKNKRGEAPDMMLWLKDHCKMLKPGDAGNYLAGTAEYDADYVLGEFVNKEAPEYTESYEKVIEKAGGAQ
jgi:2-oxoglutarate ferredoxin oxidoreductase subunit beta